MRFWDGMKALMHKLSISLSSEEKRFTYFLLKLRAFKNTSGTQEKGYLPVMAQREESGHTG